MNVMIVEGSKLIRQVIVNNLFKLGVSEGSMIEASDGAMALKILNSLKNVELILTDLSLQKLDGYELIRKIAKDKRFENSVVVVISGSLSEENRELLSDLRVYDFVPKPFNKDKFMEVLEPLLMKIKNGDFRKKRDELCLKDLMLLVGEDILESRIYESELIFDFGNKELKVDIDSFLKIAKITPKAQELNATNPTPNEEIEELKAS